jgi:long-chain acyl-CoA synthetase
LISQAVVVGDARPFIAALIVLKPESAALWAIDHGLDNPPLVELAGNAELRAVIRSAVDDANRSVSVAESIRDFALLPESLTIDGGELTPTLKVRRAVIENRYAHVIERLYGRSSELADKSDLYAMPRALEHALGHHT